jgi:hypothetical protein
MFRHDPNALWPLFDWLVLLMFAAVLLVALLS